MDTFDFENLSLYQKSLDYIDLVYDLTSDFPSKELYGLSSQLQRAASSISLNMAEGFGESIPLALRYLRISRGSIRECVSCSTIAFRRGYISEIQNQESRKLLMDLAKMSYGYRKYLIGKRDKRLLSKK
jgi:four helix bundle protein